MNYRKILQSSRLRKFLIISVIVHVTVACTTVVPYLVKEYLHARRLEMERIAREKAKKEAEEKARKAAEAAARAKMLEVLKADAEKLLEDVDAETFEQMWEELLAGMEPQIADMLSQLAEMDYQLSQQQLEAMLEQLRGAEIQNLMAQLATQSKQMIASQILQSVKRSVPQFNKKVKDHLEKHGKNTKKSLDSLLKKESRRRKELRKKASAQLDKAEKSLDRLKKNTGSAKTSDAEKKPTPDSTVHNKKTAENNAVKKNADSRLLKSARLANQAAENIIASSIRETSKNVRSLNSTHPAAADIDRIRKDIAEHKKSLSRSGAEFSDQARKALKNALSEKSNSRQKSEKFVEKTIKEKVAEHYRKRTEDLVTRVLKESGMKEDRGFAKALGQKTVDILIKGSVNELKSGSLDSMAKASAEAHGLNTAKGKGARADQEKSNSNSPSALEKAVGDLLSSELQKGMGGAIKKAQGLLKLPSAGSLGGASDKLSQLSAAAGNIGRHIRAGGMPGLPSLKRSLNEVGRAKQLGISPFIRKALSNNAQTYNENVKKVLKDRNIEQTVLKSPAAQAEASKSEISMATKRIAEILVLKDKTEKDTPEKKTDETKAEEEQKRELRKPGFKTFVYGGAPFALKPPEIDGDLSDWKDIEDFKLKGLVQKAYWKGPLPKEWENNRYLMVQWNHKGLYFAWRMADKRDDKRGNNTNFWSNDGIELLFDFSNRRKERLSKDTQHFWFWPLGSSMAADIIGGEATRGKYKVRFRGSNAPTQPRMGVKRTKNPRGYHVEVFMPKHVFAEPDLKPGRIIAFNFSINNGTSCSLIWAVNLGKAFAKSPDLWGDLALLGTDAEVTFVKPGTEKNIHVITAGEPVGVRIADADMNLDRTKKDKVETTFRSACGDSITGYLEETRPDSGIFEGSIDTEPFFGESQTDDAVLSVTGGGHVEITYMDQARKYGERNTDIIRRLDIGFPVMKLTAN